MQDFSRKMVMVLNEHLGSWELTNTVGHISAFLGNKMTVPFDTGDYFTTQDHIVLGRNAQYPIVALKASDDACATLARTLTLMHLLHVIYTQDMIDLTDDNELALRFSQKTFDQLHILGVGIFGTKQELKPITGHFPLWK